MNAATSLSITHIFFSQDVRSRYPSSDGKYRDYKSTFDAEIVWNYTY